jgi:hypothetical protein
MTRKPRRMAKIVEGSPEWFRRRRRVAADYVRALDSIEEAAAAIDRLLRDWDILDDQLKSSLLHSAVMHYARPFSDKHDYGGKALHRHPSFDVGLHVHLLKLRNNLIAHHKNETLRAQVGHGYAELNLSGTLTSALISTHCVVKALHSIENRTVAERYAQHLTVCVECLKQIATKHLEAIHNVALTVPNNAMAETDTLATSEVPIEQSVFGARIPAVLEMGAARIPNPTFPLRQDAYKYRLYASTHFRQGTYEIETPLGKAVITLSDLPSEGSPIEANKEH